MLPKRIGNNAKVMITLLFFMILILILSISVNAIPQTFNIHGKLTDDSGNALSGNYDLEFKIYNAYSGGSALWEQNKTIASDSKGIYNIILSSIDLEFDEQYYLGIKVESDDEMTPRINLTSSPYSFTTSGLDEQINLTHNVSIDQATLFIDTTNNRVGIGTTSPSYNLDVVGSVNAYDLLINGSSIASGVTGQINSTSWNRSGTDVYLANIGDNVGIGTTSPGTLLSVVGADNQLPALGSNGGSISNIVAGVRGLIMGHNTGGNYFMQVQRIDGTAEAYNLLLQPSGGNVGIGTTAPGNKLTIQGNSAGILSTSQLQISDGGGANAKELWIGYDTTNDKSYIQSIHQNSGYTPLLLQPINGNVGIGTTTPTAKLEVDDTTGNSFKVRYSTYYAPLVINTDLAIGETYLGWNIKDYNYYDKSNYATKIKGYNGQFIFATAPSGTTGDAITFTDRMTILNDGNVGIGTTSPTAVLHLKAGTATASTAPLKFTTGTLLTTPEAGTIEYLSGKYYGTDTTPTRKEFKMVDSYYGEMYEYENTTTTTIGTQDVYHSMNNFMTGSVSGFTFMEGLEGIIATIADYSGTETGTVLMTDTSHGLTTGDIITINTSTNYNGTFIVTKITNDTFYITHTWDGDETAVWSMGSYLLVNSGSDGMYRIGMNLTAHATSANTIFKFEMNKNESALDNIAVSQKFANTDYNSLSSGGITNLVAGDRIWLSCMNQTSATNITIRHSNINIGRI